MNFSTKHIILFILIAIGNFACKINYSFTGASIPEDVKTVSVKTFGNFAPLTNPNYPQLFTEALKDIFLSQTNLSLVSTNGDLQFEGAITDYKITSVAIQGNETAALNRLSITINAKFTNTKDKIQSYESKFTRFADFNSSSNLSAVEEELMKEINTQITQDIFNQAVSNW